MARLLLVRHGETEFNSVGRIQGHTDIDLSHKGRHQVELLADYLADEPIDVIYSSDLRRAARSAEIIAAPHRKSIIKRPELREINYGKIQGLTLPEVEKQFPDVAKLWFTRPLSLQFPGGESVDQLRARVARFLSELKPEPEQTVLIVAHGGPLRFAICTLTGFDARHWQQLQLDPASLSIVTIFPETTMLTRLNDTSHLKERKK